MSLSDNSPVTASQHHHPPRLPRDTTATTLHLILLTICRSTDQAALSRWEQYEGRSWRSALAPFNAASTSNNSCLWQLCIIHLVESLSPSLLDAPHSHSPLSVSLQVFSSSFFFTLLPCASWQLVKASGKSRAVFHQMLPVSPMTPVILETHKCLSAPCCQALGVLHAIWKGLGWFPYWGSILKSFAATWCVAPLANNTQQSRSSW